MDNQDIPSIKFKKLSPAAGSIKIERMEDLYDHNNGKTNLPHRHEYYTVVWVRKAEGYHLIDFNKYPFGESQVYFVGPGQIHQIHVTSRPSGWVLTFHPDFFIAAGINPGFIKKINIFRQYSDSPPITLYDDTTLALIMDLMRKNYRSDLDYHNEAMGAALELFLIECVRQCLPENKEVDEDKSCILVDFKNAVDEHYDNNHKVGSYAEMLHISPKHLNEVVKSTIGTTAKEYIIDRVLTEAKRKLLHTDQTVKHIALSLGFAEPLHFNNFFKKRTGKTPLQYRKEAL